MSKIESKQDLIELLRENDSLPRQTKLKKYCAETKEKTIDLSLNTKPSRSNAKQQITKSGAEALISALEKDTNITTLNLQNQALQDETLKRFTEVLNKNQNITTLTNKYGEQFTIINRETQRWEFNEADHDITLVGINEEALDA